MTNYWTNKFPGADASLASTIFAIMSGGNAGLMGILLPIGLLTLTQLTRLGSLLFQRLFDMS